MARKIRRFGSDGSLEDEPAENLPVPAAPPPGAPLAPVDRSKLAEAVRDYAGHRYAKNTVRAYESDLRLYERWCSANGQATLPGTAAAIGAFLLDAAEGLTLGRPRKASTISRYLASISTAHRRKGFPSPWDDEAIQDVLVSIRNKKSRDPKHKLRKKVALVDEDLYRVVDAIPDGEAHRMRFLRDRAILLLGFAGAFRRSELVSLDVEHLEFRGEAMIVNLERSKTDQAGKGRSVGIESGKRHCPVRAVREWLSAAQIDHGPIFRSVWHSKVGFDRLSDDSCARVVKEAVARVGLDPDDYGGHSLRSGWATTADRKGKTLGQIVKQTGHRDANTAMGYMQGEVLGKNSPSFGLLD